MTIRIEEHTPARTEDFKRLNVEWIERYFAVEPADLVVLDDPDGHVIDHGGRIFYAIDDTTDDAVGCVALKAEGDGVFELSKMAVAPDRRGRGIGRLLMDAVLDAYRTAPGARLLYLESNRRLEPALALYERSGFVHRQPPHPSPFSRADVYMVWEPA